MSWSCNNCGKNVEAHFTFCPHCSPFAKKKKKRKEKKSNDTITSSRRNRV